MIGEKKSMNSSFSFEVCSQNRVMLPRTVFNTPSLALRAARVLQRHQHWGPGAWVLSQLPPPASWVA